MKMDQDHGRSKTESWALLYDRAATNKTRSKLSTPQITLVLHLQQVGHLSQEAQQVVSTLFATRGALSGFGHLPSLSAASSAALAPAGADHPTDG